MAYKELDLRERRAIENMLNTKMPVSKIAAKIGRHRSTVYREIKRNRFEDDELPHLRVYYGVNAQRTTKARRARRRKLTGLTSRPSLHFKVRVDGRPVDPLSDERLAGMQTVNQVKNTSILETRRIQFAFLNGPAS